jgi:predicted site-specific integrase-resolvase
MWFSTGKIAEMEGVTSQTIRERIESGFYENVKRTQGGHYRINIQQKRRIAYARVSSAHHHPAEEPRR